MRCKLCQENAVYQCSVCGKPVCAKHVKLKPVCNTCTGKTTVKYAVQKAVLSRDQKRIEELVQLFWGEQEQRTFDKTYKVAELPAFVAKAGEEMVGFVSFADVPDDLLVVALGVLPEYQSVRVGSRLISKVESEAGKLKRKKLLVSTSNDDLPALAFYQSLGFQIYEVKPNVIAEKHGRLMKGIANLPIRDELRLQKNVL